MSPSTLSEPPASLEIRYELDSRDATAGYWQGFLGHPLARRKLLPIAGIVFVVSTGYSVVAQGLTAACGGIIGVVVGILLLPSLARWQAGRNPAFRGPHIVRVSDEGIGARTEAVGEMRILWKQIEAVRGSASHLLFHWKSGATTLIPRRAFTESGADEAFLQAAQQWHQAASETAE